MNELTFDESTGLPLLPEGYWWEIGKDKQDHDRMWLMTRGPEKVYHKKPVYGKGLKFWKVVGEEATDEFDLVERDIHVYSESFTFKVRSDRSKSEDTFPEFCELIETTYSSYTMWDRYQVPITPEGIQYLASEMWKKLRVKVEKELKEEALEAGRQQYFGKYPPKSLA